MDSVPEPFSSETLLTADRPALAGSPFRRGDMIDGKYRVDDILGAGGMGIVVGATHVALRQRVAIKLLLPGNVVDPQVISRFEREARTAATLKSEHVARVIDVGRFADGMPYMVMELLEGSDLEKIVEDTGPIAPDVAVGWILQACEAIAEAHGLGIIHRDLKPHNLFLTRRVDGAPLVKVLDFGISKMPTERDDPALTGTRDVMGSPLYMSPEQLRSVRDVDARSDIWSLGAVLFRLVTGRTPFDGETLAQLCSRVLLEAPAPIRVLRPDVPEGLAAVIDRCLQKDPAARLPTVGELARALDPFVSQHSVRAADRVIAISNRPPPSSAGSIPPPSSMGPPPSIRPPPASGVNTGRSFPPLSQSEPAKQKSHASTYIAVALVSFFSAAGVVVWQSHWHPFATPATRRPAPAAPVATPSASVGTALGSASSSAADAGPPVDVAEPAPPPTMAAPSSSAPAPVHGASAPRPKRPWVRKPTGTAPTSAPTQEHEDEAPDLRK